MQTLAAAKKAPNPTAKMVGLVTLQTRARGGCSVGV
jgi:hypothetical protein